MFERLTPPAIVGARLWPEIASVREAWRQRATATLLQLDLTGAFDRVIYTRLLAALRNQGFQQWLVYWVRN